MTVHLYCKHVVGWDTKIVSTSVFFNYILLQLFCCHCCILYIAKFIAKDEKSVELGEPPQLYLQGWMNLSLFNWMFCNKMLVALDCS